MPEERKPIEVGDGGTIRGYSDRDACTVLWVSPDETMVVVQEDRAKRIDQNGMSELQEYTFERNPEGRVRVYVWSFVRGGAWQWVPYGTRAGTAPKNIGSTLTIGRRSAYFDYSF